MPRTGTTRMSSRGQVVIPEEIRSALGLGPGSQFIVVGEGDVIVLKAVTPPAMSDFDDLITHARQQARKAGMTRADVQAAVEDVRAER